MALPPWHLWGVSYDGTFNSGTDQVTNQLVKVSYHRPDSWSFFVWLIQTSSLANPVGNLEADFDIILGLGRTTVQFVLAELSVPIVATPSYPTNIAWAAATRGFQQTESGVAIELPWDLFPASDINIQARISGGGPGQSCGYTVGAMVAPRTHIRPDWDVRQFTGGELGGS